MSSISNYVVNVGANFLKRRVAIIYLADLPQKRTIISTPGSGAGKGGGAGGSIKSSGGGLGRYGAAQEEGYFHNKGKEDLEKIKKKLKKLEEEEEAKPKKQDT